MKFPTFTKPSFIGSREYIDRPFWILFAALILVAIVVLFSASSTLIYENPNSLLGPITKQVFFIIAGIGLAYVVQLLPVYYILFGGYFIWIVSIIFLFIMLIPNMPIVVTLNGASRWINLWGFQFQPSELAKLGLIIVVADQLTRIQSEEDTRKHFLWTMGLTALTCFPIMTGNMSTAILLGGIVLLMCFLARIPWKYLGITLAIVVALAASFYCIVEFGYIKPSRPLPKLFGRAETQVRRIDNFIKEKKQPTAEFKLTDDNRQSAIAKVAIWRGGKSPFGVLPGHSKERDFLPLAYADYIFAIYVEETGIFGACILIFIYLAILFRACIASNKYEDYTAMLMTMGLALMITCQAFVSMAVTVGIGPVTGQPLPMISKGGTSVIITSLYFGIMMCVAREQNELHAKVNKSVQESIEEVPHIDLNQ